MLRRGDIVHLKEPIQGRRLEGAKVLRIKDGKLTALLLNGYEATLPVELWERCGESKANSSSFLGEAEGENAEEMSDED